MFEALRNPTIDQLEVAKAVANLLFLYSACGVVVGVVLEGKGFSSKINEIGWKLLVASLGFELLFTVAIFGIDELVSKLQRVEIISLQKRIAPRILDDRDFAAIKFAAHGKVKAVSVLSSPDTEPAMFSAQLQQALIDAGVAVIPIPSRPENRFVGMQLCLPGKQDAKGTPLWEALSAIGESPGGCSVNDPITIPLIIVGERLPYFPNGDPKSFRMRSYPGFQGPVLP